MTSSGSPERRPGGRWWIKTLAVLVALSAFLSLGWYLSEQLFAWLARPPALVAYLATVMVSLAVYGVVAYVVALVSRRVSGEPRRRLGQEILDALDRIARGDFSVRVSARGRDPLGDLAESVNRMAKQLGSLEQQRQEFISNVSHEIQSPLTSIGGFARLLRDEDVDDATRAHYFDVIVSEVERLSKLSDNLLRLSALDADDIALESGSLCLDEQVRGIALLLEPQWAEKGVSMEIDAEATVIDADEAMLGHVWINLLHNAIKFTSPGGKVVARVRREGTGARVTISDNGVGIAPGDLPHVFERFFKADKARSSGGNGLGLALAKRVVELSGGTIDVSSTLGDGAEFNVYLPLTRS